MHEIRVLLNPDFEILSSVTDGVVIAAVREWKPDAVISDVQMPGLSGIEACSHIIQKGFCSAAIILTMYNDVQLVKDALRAGILGYVLKADAGQELVSAARGVLGGSTYLSHGVRSKWME